MTGSYNKIIHHFTGGAFSRIANPKTKGISLRLLMMINQNFGTSSLKQWLFHMFGAVQHIKIKAKDHIGIFNKSQRFFFICFKIHHFIYTRHPV